MKEQLTLALVIPVYNEEECIVEVINSWLTVLNKLLIRYKIYLLDDGSTDQTEKMLDTFNKDPHVELVHKKNSGHGPTILLGYKMAVTSAEWVFQCDSDNEMKPDAFPDLWKNRSNYVALFGARAGRKQNIGRRIISICSRLTIRILFSWRISDVNTPYRLIKATVLEKIIQQIPGDTFAPNIIITGALAKSGLPVFELPVLHENRQTGNVSIVRWQLWKLAWKAFRQTLSCRPVINQF